MNFSLAAISSLALVIASATTQAEARHMRHSTNILGRNERDLIEEEEGEEDLLLELSLSMPVSNNKEPIRPHSLLPETNYTDAELELFKIRFEKTSIGAALARWQETASASSTNSSSASANGGGFTKAGKTKFCDRLLDEVLYYIDETLDDNYFPTPEVITDACSFGGTAFNLYDDDRLDDFIDRRDVYPNTGCPVVAEPTFVFGGGFPPIAPQGYFITDRLDLLQLAFGPYSLMVAKFNQYCQCHQGYELGCAAKIPYPEYGPEFFNIPGPPPVSQPTDEGSSQVAGPYSSSSVVYPGDDHAKWQEYCKFVAIWNADVSSSTEQSYTLFNGLSKEVQECGCYFVASAEAMVAECPGVELFGPYLYYYV